MTMTDLFNLSPICLLAFSSISIIFSLAIKRNLILVFFIAISGLLLSYIVSFFVDDYLILDLLEINSFNLFWLRLVLLIGILISCFIYDSLKNIQEKPEELYVLLVLSITGGLIVILSIHLVVFFLGLELLTIPAYAMLSYNYKNKLAVESGVKYLVLGGVSAAIILLGIVFIYVAGHTLYFKQITIQSEPIFLVGIILLFAGLSFKLSLAPFHQWVADVFEGTSAPILGFMATIAKGAILAFLFNLIYYLDLSAHQSVSVLIKFLAVTSMLIGSLLSLGQTNLKRLIAYSSITNLGFAMLLLVSTALSSQEAIKIFFIAYVTATLLLTGLLNLFEKSSLDLSRLENWSGLAHTETKISVLFIIALFSLMGAPLTAGLIGKWVILQALIQNGLYVLAVVVILASAISLYAYLKIVINLFVTKKEADFCLAKLSKASMSTTINYLLAIMTMLFGAWPMIMWGIIG